MDLDDFNIVGLLFGVIGGFIGLIISARMEGGAFIKIASFVITAVVCYFVGGKIADE